MKTVIIVLSLLTISLTFAYAKAIYRLYLMDNAIQNFINAKEEIGRAHV